MKRAKKEARGDKTDGCLVDRRDRMEMPGSKECMARGCFSAARDATVDRVPKERVTPRQRENEEERRREACDTSRPRGAGWWARKNKRDRR